MPRLTGLRKRRQSYYYRVRDGRNKERLIPLGRDPDKAVAKALELRRQIGVGRRPWDEAPKLTVANVVKEWLRDYIQKNRSERFAAETGRRVETYLLAFMGEEPIEDVTARTLFAYRTWLGDKKHWRTGRPLAPATTRHLLGEVRSLVNYALTVGILERSPVPPTRGWMPSLPERAPKTLTPAECKVLRWLPGEHGRVLRFLLASGLRWSEMARAQASDIRDGVLLVAKTKSGRVRRVPLPQDILAECRGRSGKLCPFSDSVSFNRRVRALAKERLATMTEEERKPLEGLKAFTAHRTRHTYATEWRDAGGSLAGLQLVLGHRSVTTTEAYGHTTDDLVLREARRLEEHRKAAG